MRDFSFRRFASMGIGLWLLMAFLAIVVNLALLAGAVWVVIWVLRTTGVIS